MKFINFLKSRLIFNIFYCFWMFVNKLFTYITYITLRISQKVKDVLMWNLQTYYFHIKANTIADFQICINVPLRKILKTANLPPFTIRLINHIYNITFVERQTDIMFGKVFVLFGIVVKMTSEIYLQYVKWYLSWWIHVRTFC